MIDMAQRTLAERFWAKVDKQHPSGCWLWTGAKVAGYGSINLGARGAGTALAHRVAWELYYGCEAPGLVCHTCDVRLCVRREHLFVGTHIDNSEDMVVKRRSPSRGRTSMTKLTPAMVAEIVTRYAMGDSMTDLAREHGVSKATLSRSIRLARRDGVMVDPAVLDVADRRRRANAAKRPTFVNVQLDPDTVQRIRALADAGAKHRDIAEAFGVTVHTVHCIAWRRTHFDTTGAS